MFGSKQSFCNTEPTQAGAISHLQYLVVKFLKPGFYRNLSQTKLETANLWNTVHVLVLFS